jgi:hypothetical protein
VAAEISAKGYKVDVNSPSHQMMLPMPGQFDPAIKLLPPCNTTTNNKPCPASSIMQVVMKCRHVVVKARTNNGNKTITITITRNAY